MVWDPIERFLWGILFAILIMGGILYFIRGKKNQDSNERVILYGFGCYFIGLAFARLFYCFGDMFIPGIYINYAFYGDYSDVSSTFEFFVRLNYISRSIGVALFLLAFENTVKRTKYILTIIQAILIILIIMLPFNLARTIDHSILHPFNIIAVIMILLIFTKQSRLELKAISSFLFFGIALIEIGLTLTSRDIKTLKIFPIYLSPIVYIIGVLIAILPLIMKPQLFSQVLSFWLIIGISVIMLALFLGFFFIYIGASFYLSFYAIVYSIVITFTIYLIISDIKSVKKLGRKENRKDILGLFTKPQKVTEEEVSISKEKKICLVCKNEVLRKNYICPECKAFYCIKCSNALEDLENACWVCNTPFDTSKPSKPFKEEGQDIDLEISEKSQENPKLNHKLGGDLKYY